VDSASSDGSAGIARDAGADVVRLAEPPALSAARSRNEGARRVGELWSGVRYVQFLDGDCELKSGWMKSAAAVLRDQPDVAAVCGRLRETRRAESVYARLLDMEFDREPGDVAACGGIFMVRLGVFREVGGFDPSVAAGEEPELCIRIRRRGHRIVRLADEMARHEGGIDRFGDWWRRAVRSGRAYAQAADLHGDDAERPGARELTSAWVWAVAVPAAALALAFPTTGWSLLLLVAHPLQVARTAWNRSRPGETAGDRLLFGAACMAAKLAQVQGHLAYRRTRRARAADRPAAAVTAQDEGSTCCSSGPS
jgi:hypothetical protein